MSRIISSLIDPTGRGEGGGSGVPAAGACAWRAITANDHEVASTHPNSRA